MDYILGQAKRVVYHDLRPTIDWTSDSHHYVICIQLSGFKTEDFRVQVENREKITVQGKRPLGQGHFSRVEQSFDVPEDSDISKISGKFVDGYLYLIIPKKLKNHQQQKEFRQISLDDDKSEKNNECVHKQESTEKKQNAKRQKKPLTEEKSNEGNVDNTKENFTEEVKEKEMQKVNGYEERHKEGGGEGWEGKKPKFDEFSSENVRPKMGLSDIEEKGTRKANDSEEHLKECGFGEGKKLKFGEFVSENVKPKRGLSLKLKVKGIERWFDTLFDDVLDFVEEKKEYIGVALIAFSAGLVFSQKLRK